jgi:hypothetical protein
MAERTGLEPATPGVTGRYSNQLNYRSDSRRVLEEFQDLSLSEAGPVTPLRTRGRIVTDGRGLRQAFWGPWRASGYSCQGTTDWRCSPSLSTPRVITSPGRRNTGVGFFPEPTPGGVPVVIKSPGSSVMKRLQ